MVITAERRTENIKDVPNAVSAISGEKLDVLNSSGQDVRFLSGRVPSLNIESSFGRAFPRFYIRGYGNTDFRLNASQPVSLIYDDVVQENPILKGFPVFDVKNVEVIAGPQGTLFGRNTPAGVVKFDSVKPGKKQEGYASFSYGTYGTSNLEGAFNLPLSGEWAARISAQVQHRDDWVKNQVPNAQTPATEGYDDRAVRIQALYEPSKTFSALFNVHNRELDGSPRMFRSSIIKPGTQRVDRRLRPGQDVHRWQERAAPARHGRQCQAQVGDGRPDPALDHGHRDGAALQPRRRGRRLHLAGHPQQLQAAALRQGRRGVLPGRNLGRRCVTTAS